MRRETLIVCSELNRTLNDYTQERGFRLDMIFPADSPRAALVSKDGVTIRLEQETTAEVSMAVSEDRVISRAPEAKWIEGRAGMQYRDLIPGRLGGRIIASHIRLTEGGPVADYVHYHKIGFQMIFCLTGRILVVYEDQGSPFWLEPGDCVLQPPQIRHRVLEAEAGSEVVEVGSPAEHETWVDHEMTLPTSSFDPHRIFGGQHFLQYTSAGTSWTSVDTFEECDIGIGAATKGLANAKIIRTILLDGSQLELEPDGRHTVFLYVLAGRARVDLELPGAAELSTGDAITVPPGGRTILRAVKGFEALRVSIDLVHTNLT
jgi:quercetin dioxygenase-like cupin family protein